jgi:protein-disulfide isomerase
MKAVLVSMLKRASLLVALLCLGCAAQVSNNTPEVNQRIARQVRNSAELSPSAQVRVGDRRPSDFGGWDEVTVDVTDQGVPRNYTFLVSKDGKTLVHYSKFDLSVDPFQRNMSKIDLAGRPVRGNKDAKVTAVVYDDFQCPYCARMYETLFDQVMKSYGDRVKVIYKDFPLYEIHPWAVRASVNANCLLEQSNDAFWQFSDQVHEKQQQIGREESTPDATAGAKDAGKSKVRNVGLDKLALDIAGSNKLDVAKVQACLAKRDTEKVRASVEEGRKLGVSATPTLFVNGERLEGAVTSEELTAVFDRALREAGEKPPAAAAGAQK